jgi:hypothetical protein
VSQLVLAHILRESQLEEYASGVSDGEDGFPDESTEVQPFFAFDAPTMVAFSVMLEEAFEDDDLGSFSQHVQNVREAGVALLLAFHVADRDRIVSILDGLAASPEVLASFYEAFYAEEWSKARTAMLGACAFVKSGLERLNENKCWFLLFVS